MHDAHEFLRSLTFVLAVAAVTTVVFQRLRQPVVLGYIVAGLIVGPHVPVPLVADTAMVQTLSGLTERYFDSARRWRESCRCAQACRSRRARLRML